MKLVRAVLISLLISLLVGLAIGTWIRLRLEAPVRYIGQLDSQQGGQTSDPQIPASSAAARSPLDIGYTGAQVLDARHHEEQDG